MRLQKCVQGFEEIGKRIWLLVFDGLLQFDIVSVFDEMPWEDYCDHFVKQGKERMKLSRRGGNGRSILYSRILPIYQIYVQYPLCTKNQIYHDQSASTLPLFSTQTTTKKATPTPKTSLRSNPPSSCKSPSRSLPHSPPGPHSLPRSKIPDLNSSCIQAPQKPQSQIPMSKFTHLRSALKSPMPRIMYMHMLEQAAWVRLISCFVRFCCHIYRVWLGLVWFG